MPERVIEAIATLRVAVASEGETIGPVSARVLAVLEGCTVANTTWNSIFRRVAGDDNLLKDVIVRIVQSAREAQYSTPAGRTSIQSMPGRYAELLQSAQRLRDEFPRSETEEFRTLARSLTWAVQFLEDFSSPMISAANTVLPSSRKGGEKIAFEKHLCGKFEAMLGTPLYDAVADLSNAIYRDDREASKELVSKNYAAERRARDAGNVEN